MYVYRSLRAEEFYNDMIWCKEYFLHAPLIGIPKYNEYFGINVLDLVGAHLTKGNNSITPWISCTRSYNRVKHYLYDKNDSVYGLAVIKNHDTEQFDSDCYNCLIEQYNKKDITYEQLVASVRRLYLYDIKKCVLDFSYGESPLFNEFIDKGYVHFRDGRKKTKITDWEHNYSKSNEEIIVLGSISDSDVYVLDPLKIDLLEYLKTKGIINELNDELLNNIVNELVIYHSSIFVNNVSYEDMLMEPLKSIFPKMSYWLQVIFVEVYLYGIPKKECMNEHGISEKDFMDYLEIIFNRIIESSEYLRDLTKKCKKNQKQIMLVNS